MKNKKDKIELTEIFMAKAGKGNKGFDKCFHGTIRRAENIVYGRINVNEGYIVANAKDQCELGDKLDELVIFQLNIDLPLNAGITFRIIDADLFLN